jgi:hypothetical protein
MSNNALRRPFTSAQNDSRVANNRSFLPVLVVIATLATIAINALANIVPFNNQTTGEISDRYPVYFVPAGYVFSIWSLIYLGLTAYSFYQVRNSQGQTEEFQTIGKWYLLSAVANSTWIFLWHWNQLALSVLVITVLLISLIGLYARMVQAGWEQGLATRGEFWCVFVPFSIYLGWGSVATIANITTWLYAIGWDGLGIDPVLWAVALLVIGAGFGIYFGLWRRNLAYALVIVWAFIGIAVKQSDVALLVYTAGGLAGVVLLLALLGWRNRITNA